MRGGEGWVGNGVGGRRKGFHAAALAQDLTVRFEEFAGETAVDDAAAWVRSVRPACVAVDSPAAWARTGRKARDCEIDFARAHICGIRFTADAQTAAVRTDSLYGWIEHGLELRHALRGGASSVIECFPTGSFTQWAGSRGRQSRAAWTTSLLSQLAPRGLSGCAMASNQDRRDAVAAALTARQFTTRPEAVLSFGTLQVPAKGSDPLG